uniref:Serpin domain-containing protein n=2 Tax=Lutzomyia longipalpis TaxID=7200 RepID=A0A1B0CNT0_LUTLO
MVKTGKLFLFIVSFSIAWALPSRDSKALGQERNIAGVASDIITSTLLKGNIDYNDNFVFSPLGFSSILAILGEGARGRTYDEINEILRHPNDRLKVRETYSEALKNLQGENPKSAPQFKTWFYIYRNNTAEDEFKYTLRKSYYVDVKDIDRYYYNYDDPKTSEPIENSKDIPNFEDLKKSEPADAAKSEALPEKKEKEAEISKFDTEIDDQQYVEVPVIKEHLKKEKEGSSKQKLDETIKNKAEPELKKLEDLEILQFAKQHPVTKKSEASARSLYENDVASALSGNSLVGEKTETKSDAPAERYESKMLLFNGLYFRGSWGIPFQQLRSDPEDVFYCSEAEKKVVTMMRSRGNFRYANCAKYSSQVIELPYENDRYSLLVVMPNEKEGLKKLITEFNADVLDEMVSRLEEASIELHLPKFSLDTTSRAEKHLAKMGLITVFTSKADLSGISSTQKLHVDELVQHVSIRVNEGASSENSLTAANAVRPKSSDNTDKVFVVDRPFLFFVRDHVDNLTVVAGKILSPPSAEAQPLL